MTSRVRIGCGLLLAVSAFGGCAQNKLTRQNFDLICEQKSTKDEVLSCLGDKHLIDRGDTWEYSDMDRKLSVWFEFDENCVVTRKQWISGDCGFEYDSKPLPEGQEMSSEQHRATTGR